MSYKEKCSNCYTLVSQDELYCPFCNEQLKKKCQRCNKLIEIDWRYCPFCGEFKEIVNYKYEGNKNFVKRF
ncbi:double zinc ribbon domain-containing protein [Thermohalobacter berrensis]|uniref:double zinc ribbon domain-containing protein n=1 Tax=Thermohalobacter berrensis TaxID=99594 RepID=UPI003C12C3BB